MPGVPWWAALLIAITATAIGYGIDAAGGHKELTHVFAGLYIAGCVAGVLAVRQDGVFTAVIQPPLILFCAVPGAYWMFHGRKVGNLKDLLINCGYPLIERFPLMLGTAGGVLLIGLVRWYFGMSHGTKAGADNNDDAAAVKSGSFFSGVAGKLNSLLGLASGDDESDEEAPAERKRTRASGRSTKAAPRTGRTSRNGSSASRASRSRHGRPPLEAEQDPTDATAERPRRTGRRGQASPRDFDPADPPRRSRRRPRPEGDPDTRSQPPRDSRRDRRQTRRNPYEWPYDGPTSRGSRLDGYDRYEPPAAPDGFDRYEPYEPSYEPRRRRTAPGGNGANPTHHPISRVRYRGDAPPDELRDEPRAEPRGERRGRSRSARPSAESWEYDV
ncbi:hypothetical protein A5764_26640 [Mycobacterium sp. 852002-51057_SCH5723018]|nr:hypothetical protein A5764_26640 [Mycobacterium sp. 852002-51057_SCH5723018]